MIPVDTNSADFSIAFFIIAFLRIAFMISPLLMIDCY